MFIRVAPRHNLVLVQRNDISRRTWLSRNNIWNLDLYQVVVAEWRLMAPHILVVIFSANGLSALLLPAINFTNDGCQLESEGHISMICSWNLNIFNNQNTFRIEICNIPTPLSYHAWMFKEQNWIAKSSNSARTSIHLLGDVSKTLMGS